MKSFCGLTLQVSRALIGCYLCGCADCLEVQVARMVDWHPIRMNVLPAPRPSMTEQLRTLPPAAVVLILRFVAEPAMPLPRLHGQPPGFRVLDTRWVRPPLRKSFLSGILHDWFLVNPPHPIRRTYQASHGCNSMRLPKRPSE